MGFVPTGHQPIKSRHFYQAGDNILLAFYKIYELHVPQIVGKFDDIKWVQKP
jgi:hypothetical protein